MSARSPARGGAGFPAWPGAQAPDDAAALQPAVDALTAPAFLVDFDARVVLANGAGRSLLAADGAPPELRQMGEALGCQEPRAPHGCGDGEGCGTCALRNAVRRAVFGGGVQRLPALLSIASGGKARDRCFLVSASPVEQAARKLAILTLEEIAS